MPRKEPHISVRNLPDGRTRYDVRVPNGRHPDTNARVFERETHGSLAEAKKARDRLLAKAHDGELTAQTPDSVGALLRRWLEDEAAGRVRASTLDDYRATIEHHLIPRIGNVKAESLTPADVHKLMARMDREGVGCRSRQLSLLRLKQALKWAAGIELLRRSAAEKVAPPVCRPEEGRAMTHAEAQDFLEAARSDHYWPIWRVFLATGLRRGEALGLRWQDVDLKRGCLSVRQQVALVKGDDGRQRPAIQEVKTAAARRTLDLDRETVACVEEVMAREGKMAQHPHVNRKRDRLFFCTAHGTPISPANIYRNMERICADAGLDDGWSPHDLRHTHATHLILAGVPIEVVSRRLGHANASITLRIYSHLLPGSEAAALDAIGRALGMRELGAG